MYEIDPLNLIIFKLESLVLKVNIMHANIVIVQPANSVVCELCGIVGHTEVDCHVSIEQACYVKNYGQKTQNDPNSKLYNPDWRNHPKYSYRNNHAHNLHRMILGNHMVFLKDLLQNKHLKMIIEAQLKMCIYEL